MAKPLELFVVSAPGLEAMCAEQLAEIGLKKTRVKAGGVTVKTRLPGLWRANLGASVALRVWRVLGRAHAQNFSALERATVGIDWAALLAKGTKLRLDVHAKKSRLYHTGAVAERVQKQLEKLGYEVVDADAGRRVQVRLVRDEVRFSLDTSGEALDRRGWKPRTAKAPLRADLARAGLRAVGWTPGQPLLDPMMGSGTIVLEAASWASGLPAGWGRRFAFEADEGFDAAAYAELRESMRGEAVPGLIVGRDRDPGAVEASTGNAQDSGLGDAVSFEQAALSEPVTEGLAGGYLVSNPPYGIRTGSESSLVGLYRATGHLAESRSMKLGLWSSRYDLLQSVGSGMEPALHTKLGGLDVTFATREPLA